MAGALRKVGLYLGLVDDEAYDDYAEDDYLEPEVEEPVRAGAVRRFDERAERARYDEPPAPRPARSAGVDRVQMAPAAGTRRARARALPHHDAAPAQLQRGPHDRRELPRGHAGDHEPHRDERR